MKRLPSPALIVLVGPSGSGKSTWAAENFDTAEIVSSDDLRSRVGAGPTDLSASNAAFDILDLVVAERVSRGLTTVIDTLGLDPARRSGWLELAHQQGLGAHAVVFETPLEVCLERNSQRPDPLPQDALKKQHRQMKEVESALVDEGFDGVVRDEPLRVVPPQMVDSSAAQPGPARSNKGKHRFGLILSRFNWSDRDLTASLVSIARRAEAAGFEDLWLMDHFRQIRQVGRPWEDIPEVYATLSFLAGHTSLIRLGALVTSITHRPPMVLGRALATLDVLSGGRAVCGLGIGWDEEEHGSYGIEMPGLADRYGLLSESIDALRLLWGKGTPEFQGSYIRATSLACYPRPIQDPIPILVGGSGERKTLRLVAEKADACNVFGTPERVAHKVEVLTRHCASLGRDPAEIDVTHLVNAMADPDRDNLRTRGTAAKGASQSFDEFSTRNNAGTTEDLVRLFSNYRQAGATHSIVAIPDVHTEGAVEAFAPVIAELG